MVAFWEIYATSVMLLAILAFCNVVGRPTMEAFKKPAATAGDICVASNINIQQAMTSGVGNPTFTVQIVNLCRNRRCTISNVIINYGHFHSAGFVNPNKFKRYGTGTCIVNNGGVVPNAGTITFKYAEIMRQNLSLHSAKVTCD